MTVANRLRAQPLNVNGEPTQATFDGILSLEPPYYIDRKAGLCGPLDFGVNPRVAAKMVSAPKVMAREAPMVAQRLKQFVEYHNITKTLPPLETTRVVETRHITPTSVLKLLTGSMKYDTSYFNAHTRYRYYRSGPFEKTTLALARLSFDYAGQSIAHHDTGTVLEVASDGKIIVCPRDLKSERTANQVLTQLGFEMTQNIDQLTTTKAHGNDFFMLPEDNVDTFNITADDFINGDRFITLSTEIVPWLIEDKGWRVEIAGDYPYRLAEGEVDWWADVENNSSIDWFSFALGVEFEGQKINLLPTLITMISSLPEGILDDLGSSARNELLESLFGDNDLWHKLPDGRLFAIKGERIMGIMTALLELAGPKLQFANLTHDTLQFSPLNAAAFVEFGQNTAQVELTWCGHERLTTLGEKLRTLGSLPEIAPPLTLQPFLRAYQVEGLSWLTLLHDAGLGGILADDMGLGKTLQALSFILNEKQCGRLDKPVLIISPTSVLSNWQAEAQKFTPQLSVLPLRGQRRAERFGEIANHDIILSTYPLLTRDKDVLLAQSYHSVILDEAQAIKNPKATVSTIVTKIQADGRFALTGTPLENNLGDVLSLFNFLNPGFLGDSSTFRKVFRTPIEKHNCMTARTHLSSRLKPFLLRRTKDEVAAELPEKTEIIEYVELEAGQRDLYETVRLMMDAKVRETIDRMGLNRSHIIVLDALLKLRQVCCDPQLVKLAAAKKVTRSAKLQRLKELLPEMISEGRRILLFSQFTSMLSLIKVELTKLGIDYVILTGKTKDRDTPIKAFQSGEVPVFLISLKAGGTGLNLTAADTVIHYDPWWNPAVENQATDRAHRIGQDKPVFVHKLIIKNSLEEAIQQLKDRKSELATALFSDKPNGKFEITEADLAALFAPLG